MSLTVAALYRFAPFDEPAALREPLLGLCAEQGVKGTLLLAREGINGTIAGSAVAIAAVIEHIRGLPGCAELDVKYSLAASMPFQRLKVRLKKEIVTMKVPGIDPARDAGTYIDPAAWNALADDPNTVLIDTRNAFEVSYGSFDGAVNPQTQAFGDFPGWWRANAQTFAGKRIAMYCTGGIRCEKSTAFLRAEGVDDVVHLKGGILAYLEQVPESESRWQGSCFVFDERVSVGHGLVEVGEKPEGHSPSGDQG
ncbi:rhodanese-related sulfurtransferase [Altererythrobacter sp. Root672]|uniref:oxygen-dependent tRNA uridine(34) hydroxylase TrhO n=1 Tax=Altererythrobacter sp. Root672 TaxID=1736584 RepID=UPI0006FC7BF2|nr:rhodanese-related sulfurtransferase [Altererythrobacter sp. Root672]KRA84438.1 hypothetical protein ASD76_10810 [Altererythrobacter sp. Root672]